MDRYDAAQVANSGELSLEIATRSTDPDFYSALHYLPNPDPILRKLGKSQEVYDAVRMDAHVIGELRSVRSALLGFEWRLQAGGERPADQRALALCQDVMAQRPAAGMRWSDVIWNMAEGVFRGYAVHEVVWDRVGGYVLPVKVMDRPQRRFLFSPDNELRLRTRDNALQGIEVGAYKWLVTRHMPSFENPYGLALFSSCFWPYTFKHSGFRYFVKFCEKYGIPWALGKYPAGTPKPQQDELVEALAGMVEDGVAAVQDGASVELIESTKTGQLAHERLVDVCNREMSKALTSQTLATEIQGDGSRAAAETHRGREQSVNESDRQVVCDTFNEFFGWITEINVADAVPPTFEFYEEAEARKEWVDVLDGARAFLQVPVSFAHERLQIPQPKDGEDVLPRSAPAPSGLPTFSAPSCPRCNSTVDHAAGDPVTPLAEQAASEADGLIDNLAQPVRDLLDRVATLQEFRDGLAVLYPDIDETGLAEMTSLALMTGLLQGMDAAD